MKHMHNDEYLNEFLASDEPSVKQKAEDSRPTWVSKTNSSYCAYHAILKLKQQKKAYIKKHSLKSQYTRKSTYQIGKSEVALIVKKNAQPLFNSNSYSKELVIFFNDINSELEEKKEQRINKSKRGIRNKRKEDLINEHQQLIKSHQDSQVKVVNDVYQKVIDNMPLDVKRKLRLE
ncbi:MAG: hypothetical protein ABNH21_17380 [Glaciecola sp.]